MTQLFNFLIGDYFSLRLSSPGNYVKAHCIEKEPSHFIPQFGSWARGGNPQVFSVLVAHYHFLLHLASISFKMTNSMIGSQNKMKEEHMLIKAITYLNL
jgi:hypothetical protein